MNRFIGKAAVLCFICCALPGIAIAQTELDERPMLSVSNGLSFQKDSVFLLNIRFRMQNRIGFKSESGSDLSPESFEGRIRRLRLRFDGFMLDERFGYYIQLSFSKADQDLENTNTAQTIRDAILYYTFSPSFYVGFGQSKLPGNRQRVTSSGNLQFADRSIANAAFNIDRDFGIFGYYTKPLGAAELRLKGAISTGDGRNASEQDDGLAYTGRLEFLPFGVFSNDGDYYEADLAFEQKPKLSLGVGYSYNNKARRKGGQTGSALFAPRDIETFIADALLKYNGFSFSVEYFQRFVDDPITTNTTNNVAFVLRGYGINSQVSRMLTQTSDLAVRFSTVQPRGVIKQLQSPSEEYLTGYTRFFNKHKIKAQLNAGYTRFTGNRPNRPHDFWTMRFQIEFGI